MQENKARGSSRRNTLTFALYPVPEKHTGNIDAIAEHLSVAVCDVMGKSRMDWFLLGYLERLNKTSDHLGIGSRMQTTNR